MCASGTALAQQTSGIAGVLRDTSGAVLPGVTVEATSPALIEKVRSVLTDEEGLYRIVDLRPGTYVVTFSLSGFKTVRREGIELTSGFTATINGELEVGGLEETVTVTGEAALVDAQNVRRQNIVSNELLEMLPTSNKTINTVVTFTPGFTGLADVGGQYTCQLGGGCSTSEGFHGKKGTKVNFDGMGMENMAGVGNSSYQLNAAAVEEMVLQTSGISADTNADGPVLNIIPREGGNTFHGTLLGVYSNDKMEGDNLPDALRARGLITRTKHSRSGKKRSPWEGGSSGTGCGFSPPFGTPVTSGHTEGCSGTKLRTRHLLSRHRVRAELWCPLLLGSTARGIEKAADGNGPSRRSCGSPGR